MKVRPSSAGAASPAVTGLVACALALSGCSREIGAEPQQPGAGVAAPLHAGSFLPPSPLPAASAPGSASTAAPDLAPPEAVAERRGSDLVAGWSSVLHSERDAEVATRVAGTVASVGVELGDRVRAGQLLATLRDEAEQVALEAARAALELARLEHERVARLREQGLLTQAESDLATYRMRASTAALRDAEVRLEYTRIRAPFDGAVTRRFVRVGQSVEEREPIVRVTALRPLRALVRVPEAATDRLSAGQTLRLRGLSGEWVEGRISRIAPAVDPVGGTVEVLIEVPQPGTLRPGSAVTVEPDAVNAGEAAAGTRS